MARLVLNDAAIADLLIGPGGPVYRATHAFAEAVSDSAAINAPVGFDQGGRRVVGLLSDGMAVQSDDTTVAGPAFTVGSDPRNPDDGYHYAEAVHRGRGPIHSETLMKFSTESGYHEAFSVGPAAGIPFMYNAVDAVNAVSETKFVLIKT